MTLNPFQRLAARKPSDASIFCQDHHFHTAGYSAWLKLGPTTRPSWPAYRDAQVKKQGKAALGRKKTGHGDAPLGPLSPRGTDEYLQRQRNWSPNGQRVAR